MVPGRLRVGSVGVDVGQPLALALIAPDDVTQLAEEVLDPRT